MRSFQNQTLKELLTIENIQSVLNIGTLPNDPDKEGGYYKDYFAGKDYYTLDKNRHHDHPNHFNLDVQDLSKIDKRFDLELLLNTLEHVINPFEAIQEITSVIKVNGYLFISTPYLYPTHKNPMEGFSDYWRFTDDALRVLCSDLQEVWIKNAKSVIKKVEDRGNYWDDPVNTTSGYCALFKKV